MRLYAKSTTDEQSLPVLEPPLTPQKFRHVAPGLHSFKQHTDLWSSPTRYK